MHYSVQGWSDKFSDLLGFKKFISVTSIVTTTILHELEICLSLLLTNVIQYNKYKYLLLVKMVYKKSILFVEVCFVPTCSNTIPLPILYS